MIKELIKVATQLDARGYYKEADYLDALLGKNAHEEEASEGSNKLVSKFALILEIEQPPGLDDLISQGQQKYSDMLPEGESFAKIDKSHVTLIPGKIFKTINKDDQSAIVEKLGESTVLTPIVDTGNIYLATREMEGRKTLYLKLDIDNSEAINSAVQKAVAEVASINVPEKYMHMSIANVHGGNPYQSVGDINENDEYDENKVIVSAVQQKKKEKKPQQKKKGGPGGLVKRLKGARMPDSKIREILSKAHPDLSEKDVDNMLANITASRETNMLKELIKVANSLDKNGLRKEADYLDGIIQKLAAERGEEEANVSLEFPINRGFKDQDRNRFRKFEVGPITSPEDIALIQRALDDYSEKNDGPKYLVIHSELPEGEGGRHSPSSEWMRYVHGNEPAPEGAEVVLHLATFDLPKKRIIHFKTAKDYKYGRIEVDKSVSPPQPEEPHYIPGHDEPMEKVRYEEVFPSGGRLEEEFKIKGFQND